MSEHLSNTDLKRLHRDWRKKTDNRLALIIDGIQGPYNVGSIIRSSAAERVDFAWFSSGSTTPENTKTGKQLWGLIAILSGQNALTSFKQLKPLSQKDTELSG